MGTRKNAPRVAAVIAGEPTDILSGYYVEILWGGYDGARGAGATHESESAADRNDRGQYVAAVRSDYSDRRGRYYGAAIRLDGGMVHHGNDHAVMLADGTPDYRWKRDAAGKVMRDENGDRIHVLDNRGRPTVVGRWLPLFALSGKPTSQLVSVTPN